ncbi:FG-nucleoporin nsp1 [Pleurotus pulmonarius]|nr:FG-nucleoporin nsp1 [Pleurotus pulmonarius]KAF4600902.1 FG-nucleoporin nsp1 [Pleurotus pulmonarius]
MSFFNTNSSSGAPNTGANIFGGSNQSSAAPSTGNLFGAAKPATGNGLFGSSGTTSLFGNANTSTTPAAGGGLFGNSASNTGAASNASTTQPLFSGFGNNSNQSSAPTFGAPAASSSTTANPAPTLGQGLFNLPKAPESSTPTAQKAGIPNFFAQPANAGNATASTTAPSAPTAPSGGLFGFNKPADPPSNAQSTTSTTQPPAGGLFGNGLFGKPAAPAAATTTPKDASQATATPAAPSGGLFGSLGTNTTAEKKDGAPAPSQPAFNLFGKPAEKKDAPTAAASTSTAPGTDKPKDAAAPSTSAPGASTATPSNTSTAIAVPPPSMLRGKTIEEIVNRWSNELETHVRDFNRFAGEIAVWDRALIENGKSLATLFSHVTAVEREQNEIDQSLDHIEQQQKDLSSTLDSYEKAMQDILGGQGSLRALDTGPADTERDKNYMLATDLHTQLDDLSGSLTQMIESVNGLSLSSGSKDGTSAEDPMTQIAQILSSHLESLQWIDGSVKEVEGKVTEVENRVKSSGLSLTGNNSGATKSRGFGLR